MSRFIVVTNVDGDKTRVSVDHIISYGKHFKGSGMSLDEYDTARHVTETPEEIDALIEEVEKDPCMDEAIKNIQAVIDTTYPPLSPPLTMPGIPLVAPRFDTPPEDEHFGE